MNLQEKQKQTKIQVKIFESAAESCLDCFFVLFLNLWRGWNQKHKQCCSLSDGVAVLCTWHETWGQPVQPVQQTTTTAKLGLWQEQGDNLIQAGREGRRRRRRRSVSWQTCAEEEKKKRLWQNILKALPDDDWLIAPSPIACHRHRQQVHFIHL